MIGSIRLSTCCTTTPTTNNGLLPICPITTAIEEVTETISFNTGDLSFELLKYKNGLPGCTLNDRVVLYGAFDFLNLGCTTPDLGGVVSASINMESQERKTWTATSVSSDSGFGGSILRSGTNIVIASGASWIRQNVTLSQSSYFLRRNTPGQTEDSGIQNRTVAGAVLCCDPDITEPWFCTVREKPATTTTNFTPGATRVVKYLPVVSSAYSGLSVFRNTSVSSGDPWTVQVSGGVISLTSATGTRHEFSGSLTTVRNSINALGPFTASLGSGVNGTNALVSDLKPKIINDMYRNISGTLNCIGGSFNIAEPGDEVAPGINGNPAQGTNGLASFDAQASGRPNTHAGYLEWLSSPYFPKLSNINPIADLGYEGAGTWTQTSGASEREIPVTSTATKQVIDIQLTCGPRCVTFAELNSFESCAGSGWDPYDNCPSPYNTPFYSIPADCPPGTFGTTFAWYVPQYEACPSFFQVVCTSCVTSADDVLYADKCVEDVGGFEVISKTVTHRRTINGRYLAS